jgi:hypothetical protein
VEQFWPFLELLGVDDARVGGVQFDEAGDVHYATPVIPSEARDLCCGPKGPSLRSG